MLMNAWIKDVKAKGGVDTDGFYGKQCVDLHNDYCHRVLGLPGKTGASCAKKLINNVYLLEHCKKIKNYLEFIPEKGDIAVWTGGEYGHVAIVLEKGNINTFKSLDQNWVSQKLTEETHNYTYLAPLYFLRPLDQSNINPKKEEAKVEGTKTETTAETNEENVETKPIVENGMAEEETKSAEDETEKAADTSKSSHENILIKILNLLKQLINLLFK